MVSSLQRPESAKKRGPIEIVEGKNVRIPIFDAGNRRCCLLITPMESGSWSSARIERWDGSAPRKSFSSL